MAKIKKTKFIILGFLLNEYKKIEVFLKQHESHKTYWLKTLQLGIAHLELDIRWLQHTTNPH